MNISHISIWLDGDFVMLGHNKTNISTNAAYEVIVRKRHKRHRYTDIKIINYTIKYSKYI